MDEKGLKKIIQIITTILKLKKEGKMRSQGFNDRIGVAKDIYTRNSNEKEFLNTLNKSITNEMKSLYELIYK